MYVRTEKVEFKVQQLATVVTKVMGTMDDYNELPSKNKKVEAQVDQLVAQLK